MHTSIDYRIVYNRQDMETTIECPSIDERKSICYSAIKKKKHEILPFAKWMYLESIMLN